MKALGVVEIQNKWFWHSFTLQYPPASTEAKKKKKTFMGSTSRERVF
jgi:hypothetical protein